MCLYYQLPIPEYLKTGEHKGFKVGYFDGDYFITCNELYYIQLREWVKDESNKKLCCYNIDDNGEYDDEYDSGFHIFLTEEAAKDWAMSYQVSYRQLQCVSVEFSDIVAYGKQRNRDVVVAKKIKVLA